MFGARESLKVFISYARADSSAFAEDLLAGLEVAGFDPFLDRHDIAAGEDWDARLERLIASADTVVFVISPASVRSEQCAKEVERALELSKRLIPVVAVDVHDRETPEPLRKLNYIFFTRGNSFARALAELSKSLRTDLDWIREHTRLGEAAERWRDRDRSKVMLLHSSELEAAQAWLAGWRTGAPEPTDLQRAFISASAESENDKLKEERRRLDEIQQAQVAREHALKRLSRRTTFGLVAAGGLVTAGVGLAYWGWDAERRFTGEKTKREDLLNRLATGTLTQEQAGEIAEEVLRVQYGSARSADRERARAALLELAASPDPNVRSSVASLTDAASLAVPVANAPDPGSRLFHTLVDQFGDLNAGMSIEMLDRETGEPLPSEGGRMIVREGTTIMYRVKPIPPLSGTVFLVDRLEARETENGAPIRDYVLVFPNPYFSNQAEDGFVKVGGSVTIGGSDSQFQIRASINKLGATQERGELIAFLTPRALDMASAVAQPEQTRGFAADMDRRPATIEHIQQAMALIQQARQLPTSQWTIGAATTPYEIRRV